MEQFNFPDLFSSRRRQSMSSEVVPLLEPAWPHRLHRWLRLLNIFFRPRDLVGIAPTSTVQVPASPTVRQGHLPCKGSATVTSCPVLIDPTGPFWAATLPAPLGAALRLLIAMVRSRRSAPAAFGTQDLHELFHATCGRRSGPPHRISLLLASPSYRRHPLQKCPRHHKKRAKIQNPTRLNPRTR